MRLIVGHPAVASVLLITCCVALTSATQPSDSRPSLVIAARSSKQQTRPSLQRGEQVAVKRLQVATQGVVEAARRERAAKTALREARREANDAMNDLEKVREQALAAVRDSTQEEESVSSWQSELRRGRLTTLLLLIGFTFMNGVARRSLSSAAPSLVESGLLTVGATDSIFMVGFEAFAMGKLLVVPTTLLLGVRRSLLLQLAVMTLACGSYFVIPGRHAAQLGAWVIFRVFSAMAVSTMLPFVGAWFPRRFYGRAFALLFTGFQAGYLFASYYWGGLLVTGRLHWATVFGQTTAGFALLLGACALWLRERPPQLPTEGKGPVSSLLARVTKIDGAPPAAPPRVEFVALIHKVCPSPQISRASSPISLTHLVLMLPSHACVALMRKVSTRWVFWAMLLACAAYTPAVEYSTHVTSYLKEMQSAEVPSERDSSPGIPPAAPLTEQRSSLS